MSSYLCYSYLAILKSQAELRFATAHLGFGLFANRLQVGEFIRLANMAPKRTRNAVESSASSAGKKAPFSSQLQKWMKDEGVDTRKMDPVKATKFYKLKDWCLYCLHGSS